MAVAVASVRVSGCTLPATRARVGEGEGEERRARDEERDADASAAPQVELVEHGDREPER